MLAVRREDLSGKEKSVDTDVTVFWAGVNEDRKRNSFVYKMTLLSTCSGGLLNRF